MNATSRRVIDVLQKHIISANTPFPLKSMLQSSHDKLIQYRNGEKTFRCAPNGTIYANHYLDLSEISVMGFDLDYTLVVYTEELQHLIYNHARNMLVENYGYPAELRDFHFDSKFAIRGLSADTRNGVLCKLSYLQRLSANRCFKGKMRLSTKEMEALYGASRHVSLGDLNKMRPLNDEFSSAEACLIADAMQCFQHLQQNNEDSRFVPSAIIDDVQGAIREVHVSGAMKNAVVADPERFIKRSPHLDSMLTNFGKAGKKIFLLTNSHYSYASRVIQYALGVSECSKMHSLRNSWTDLFDTIICSSNKPDFYSSRRTFRRWNTRLDCPDTAPVDSLVSGEIYVQGSSREMQRLTGWRGHDILYVGDNLRADLVEARRWHGWRTACIIGELQREKDVLDSPECYDMHFLRSLLRQLIHDLQNRAQSVHQQVAYENGEPDFPLRHEFTVEEMQLLNALQYELFLVNKEFSELFSKYFGSMFRTDGHPSLYAFMMLRYVDIYMSDATDFINYNPEHRFFPRHAINMAHHPRSHDE